MTALNKIVFESANDCRDLTIHFVASGLLVDETHAVRIVESADIDGQLDVIDLTAEQMDQMVAAWLDFRLTG